MDRLTGGSVTSAPHDTMRSVRSDIELVRDWREGDVDAGSELFDRHFAILYRFFSNKIGGGAGVEDLIQETYLACVESRDALSGVSSFRSYLLTVARHALYAHWNKRRKDAVALDVAEASVEDMATSPSAVVARKGEHRLLLQALRGLPLDLQIAVELHYWEELPGPELAEILGVPEGTVRSRLRRARELIEERLRRMASGSGAELVESVLDGLDGWATSLREQLVGSAE
jgi:RNA polymerase sigma-70 factor (ECF subfamily)